MRILTLSQYFPPDLGGGSRRANNALLGLTKRGHEIIVVTAFPHYPAGDIPKKYRSRAFVRENYGKMKLFRVWVPALPHRGFIKRLVMYISFAISALIALPFVGKIDIIWAANSNVFSSFSGIVYSFFKRRPLVRNVDDLWPETAVEEGILKKGFGLKIGELLAKISYKLCKYLTPISNGYVDYITCKYGIPRNKFRVVWHGVETDIFRPVIGDKKLISHELEDQFVVLYSGVLGPGYDFELLFKAAEYLKNEGVTFIIRGFGPRILEFQKKVHQRKLDNVLIISKRFEINELVEFMCTADAFLLPMMPLHAHEAGIPTKLFEYLACGKPVIVSSTGTPASLVKKINAGIVTTNNAQEFAEAVSSLSRNPDLCKKLGLNGRMFIEQHLSIDTIGKRMEDVFELL